MTEKQLEEMLVKAVEKRGGKAYKFTSPGQMGVPDRLVVLPGNRIGFVEVKKPGKGKLSRIQIYQLDQLNKRDCNCYVLDDPKGIQAIIQDLFNEDWITQEAFPYLYPLRRGNEI